MSKPMVKNPIWQRGYAEGLRDGRKKADMTIADNDLMFVYGMMCLWLKHTQGFGQKRIEKACRDIQKMWCNYGDYAEKTRADGNIPETVLEMVERETGVNFMQIISGEEMVEANDL